MIPRGHQLRGPCTPDYRGGDVPRSHTWLVRRSPRVRGLDVAVDQLRQWPVEEDLLDFVANSLPKRRAARRGPRHPRPDPYDYHRPGPARCLAPGSRTTPCLSWLNFLPRGPAAADDLRIRAHAATLRPTASGFGRSSLLTEAPAAAVSLRCRSRCGPDNIQGSAWPLLPSAAGASPHRRSVTECD